MESRNNIIHIEIFKKKKKFKDIKRNTPEKIRTGITSRYLYEKEFIQKSLVLESSHHFDEFKKDLSCVSPSIQKQGLKLHVLKFYGKPKNDEINSVLRISPMKSFRSLTPTPITKLQVPKKLPKIPAGIVITSSEYRLKNTKIINSPHLVE